MIERKLKPLTENELNEIKSTLDIIDISLYDLLQKRIELLNELNKKTDIKIYDLSKSISNSIEKITSQRKYNKDILSSTIGILELTNLASQNATIGIVQKKETDLNNILSHIQNLFPIFEKINYKIFSKYTDIIKNIGSIENIMGIVPATNTTPKDVWWLQLLSLDKQEIKITNKIPLLEGTGKIPEYIINKTSKYWNFDRSIIAIATSETITKSWLKSALHRLQIPLYETIDSTAIFNGSVLHLIEISYAIKDINDKIFKLNETINGVNIRTAGYLGGYFLPIIDKDKILTFKTI